MFFRPVCKGFLFGAFSSDLGRVYPADADADAFADDLRPAFDGRTEGVAVVNARDFIDFCVAEVLCTDRCAQKQERQRDQKHQNFHARSIAGFGHSSGKKRRI